MSLVKKLSISFGLSVVIFSVLTLAAMGMNLLARINPLYGLLALFVLLMGMVTWSLEI